MAQLLALNPSASVLLVNRQILLLDVAQAACVQCIDLPAVRQPAPAAPTATDDQEADGAEAADQEPAGGGAESKTPAPVASNRILHSAISPNRLLLALATADEKHLHLFRLNEDYAAAADASAPFATWLSSRPLSRTSNALRFASDSRQLLVADKTGDCFAYACDAADGNADQPGQCVLSHLSMVLGILQTPDGRHVLSCDRDEKIRCTNWPRTALIESYMLGHSEYVAAVELLLAEQQTLAVSVSGDRSLRVWDYLSGRQLAQFELPAPALRMAVRATAAKGRWLVAVSLHEHISDLVVLELRQDSAEAAKFTSNTVAEIQLEGVVHVQSVQFEEGDGGSILVAAITRSDESAVFRLVADAKEEEETEKESSWSYRLDTLDTLNAVIAERAADLLVPFNSEEIGLLFKKKFHNIDDYQERKKRRIEEKNSKQQQQQEKQQEKLQSSNGGGRRGGKRAALADDAVAAADE